MKDQWLKDIRDRMADFETEEPAGLWDDIESGLTVTPTVGQRSGRRRVVIQWSKRLAGVAAMIAVVLTVGILINGSSEIAPDFARMESTDNALTEGNTGLLHETPVFNESVGETVYDVAMATGGVSAWHPENVKEETASGGKNDMAFQYMSKNGNDSLDVLSDSIKPYYIVPDVKERNKNNKRKEYYHASARDRSGEKSRFSVGAFTSGGAGVTADNISSIMSASDAVGSDGALWEDKPMLGILLFNKGKELQTEFKHRLPVRTGMTVDYYVSDRVSLETGFVYTNLTSDIRFGGDTHYLSGKQTLHYVGVPVNVKYRAYSWKRLDVYASGGILGEKCVSGKINKDYIIDGQKRETEKADLSVKPLQWSLNVSAGVQFNISKLFGIYAEPGVSCYFDNGSSVRTIYKDKPFNFNLNLGLRLKLGNK